MVPSARYSQSGQTAEGREKSVPPESISTEADLPQISLVVEANRRVFLASGENDHLICHFQNAVNLIKWVFFSQRRGEMVPTLGSAERTDSVRYESVVNEVATDFSYGDLVPNFPNELYHFFLMGLVIVA